METVSCLAILWLLWLVSSKSGRRRWIQLLAAVIIAISAITSPAFLSLLTWGLSAKLAPDLGQRADAIVVLGRGSSLRADRMAEAWHLWQAERAPQIFASGMMDAKYIVKYLQERGVATSSLAGEECSQTTAENAIFSSALLRPQGVHDILLVTDLPHMERSSLVFRSVGFNVIPHAVALNAQTLSRLQQTSIVVREYLGLALYSLTGKFQKQSRERLDNPSPEVLQRISQWNCKVPRSERTKVLN